MLKKSTRSKGKPVLYNHAVEEAVGTVMPKLINHDLKDCMPANELAQILGLARYSGRALPITEPDDLIQLHPSLRPEFEHVANHYDRIGLPFTRQVIWDDRFDVAHQYPDYELSVFFFGSRAHGARPDLPWANVAAEMNRKNRFLQLCQELGLPTPQTYFFTNRLEVKDLDQFQYPCRFKVSFSVSGLGVQRCLTPAELGEALEQIGDNVEFQIQEELPEGTAWLNVQYEVNGSLRPVLVTQQVLKGNAHDGNACPCIFHPWALTDPLALWMAEQGMKGIFAFDLAVCGDRMVMIECNPRFNGASYPTIVANKMAIPEWISKNFTTSARSLADLDLQAVEYDSQTGKGVIIFNWGCITDGKLGIMLAAPMFEQVQLEQDLIQLLR